LDFRAQRFFQLLGVFKLSRSVGFGNLRLQIEFDLGDLGGVNAAQLGQLGLVFGGEFAGRLGRLFRHPLQRENTGDNTPAVIHTEIVPGDKLKIVVAPKGGGSENMSGVRMLKPSDGVEGVKQFVLELVQAAGSNPCPPIIVGVGIGGTMEMAAILAKKALLRRVGDHNPNPADAELESELLDLVNSTGIGPAGLGGRITALAVNVETYPCHIASLPVAVNIQCHAARHKEVVM
jgi:fumarate hydratase subunit alpha